MDRRASAPPSATRPARRDRQLTWLFDLDNTLHNASAHVFPHINRAMTAYIVEHLALDHAGASRLRQHYWQRYGATLLGLIRHHAIDPAHFLTLTHQFDDLGSLLVTERGLRDTLRRSPGRKIVFSNGPATYAEAVLRLSGLRDCFDAVYAIEQMRFVPKPAPAAFYRVLHAERLDPRRCIMVEDSAANLATAKRLGMKTVWVSTSLRRPPHVDIRVRSVLDLPHRCWPL
ncbi:pyrimidine 5'-nucleotidase [Rhodocyclus tenuis]|uniref:Pyrimidine 5'-nucleotidase n=1 Tax=Rhodocyclus gracilis TaxID=2929842 RepID=A0ABX0WEP5_9RHOO|nr:pyrimidine 5'-nucleotidase [Rhodocyclus gracilis]NJA88196.1 pyrimidine 5'-nucleotidase [Rhodocyclus gracilis]